jgi:hypothetical protein
MFIAALFIIARSWKDAPQQRNGYRKCGSTTQLLKTKMSCNSQANGWN